MTLSSFNNRISTLLMEVLQMLKFHLKKERLNFMEGWVMSEREMTKIEPEEGLLEKLLDPSFRDTIDHSALGANVEVPGDHKSDSKSLTPTANFLEEA
ncbi:hypothetical protein AZE42_13034 [Rhizopogon vesiculosus]|uniref:Uncharacterized protein n=1 Tax=Rhizopogon vesiculosus TaxID=180088 RepID=A0A1J8R698_9AGAM|nr:hypothetical protein AZE42_13034 [Rhizopogon vesiculosus]